VTHPPAAGALPEARDRAIALLLFAAAGSLYVRTMAPGLVGDEDTPKFQLLGWVLGTGHAPGYPLFVMVSYAFSWLPVGNPAYRANLVSVAFGAASVAVLYLILRGAERSRAASCLTALAFACGEAFWHKSLLAEVYTLGCALLAGTLLMLLRWRASRQPRDLYAAATCTALAIGNHLTIGAVAPAVLLFLVLVEPRLFRRPRVVVTAGLIVLSGFLLYGFIVLRTWQRAPYLEERAHTVRELVYVVRAGRFAALVGRFDVGTIVHQRIPVLAGLARKEMTDIGLVFFVGGAIWMLVFDQRLGVLVLGSLAGLLALIVNVDGDLRGFLAGGAFLLMWTSAGCGLHALVRGLSATRPYATAAVLIATTAVLPARLLVRNYGRNDLHEERRDAEFFTALFQALPSRTAFVSEVHPVDNMLAYMLLAEHAQGEREVVVIPRDPDAVRRHLAGGYQVFAFPRGRAALSDAGLAFEPFVMHGMSAVDVVAGVPRLTLIAAAALGDVGLDSIAGAAGVQADAQRTAADRTALMAVTGAGGEWKRAPTGTTIHFDPPGQIGGFTYRERIRIVAEDQLHAEVGATAIHATGGLVLIITELDGTLLAGASLRDARDLLPIDLPTLPLWRAVPSKRRD